MNHFGQLKDLILLSKQIFPLITSQADRQANCQSVARVESCAQRASIYEIMSLPCEAISLGLEY